MGNSGELSEIGNALLAGSTWNMFGMQAGGPLGYTYPSNDSVIDHKRPQITGNDGELIEIINAPPPGSSTLNII